MECQEMDYECYGTLFVDGRRYFIFPKDKGQQVFLIAYLTGSNSFFVINENENENKNECIAIPYTEDLHKAKKDLTKKIKELHLKNNYNS